MSIYHIIAAIFGSVVFWAGQVLDLITSVRGPYFGTSESTKFLRNEDGDIDVKRKWLISIAFFAGGWAIFLFIHSLVGVLWLFLMGGLGLWQAYENDKKQKINREKQLTWLTRSAQHSPDDAETLYLAMHFNDMGILRMNAKTKLYAYSLFKWIQDETPEALRRKLIAHANKPSQDWFPPEGRL